MGRKKSASGASREWSGTGGKMAARPASPGLGASPQVTGGVILKFSYVNSFEVNISGRESSLSVWTKVN